MKDHRPSTIDHRPPGGREGQTFSGESCWFVMPTWSNCPHPLRAPFALLGVLEASFQRGVTWRQVGLVVIAFSAARWVAMAFNRIVDREFDARIRGLKTGSFPAGR